MYPLIDAFPGLYTAHYGISNLSTAPVDGPQDSCSPPEGSDHHIKCPNALLVQPCKFFEAASIIGRM